MVTTAVPCTTWISRSWREVAQQRADDHRRDPHADQEHHVEQRDDPRPRLLVRPVGGERQPRGLGHVHAEAGHQERQRRRDLAADARPAAPCRR